MKPAKIKGQFPYSRAKTRGITFETEMQKTTSKQSMQYTSTDKKRKKKEK